MLIFGDLGFSSLVLVVCFIVSSAGLVVRKKWRASAARKEEIRRLLVMASEEAARAELEGSQSYIAAPPPVSWPYQCAVCYCPTTTRCRRCKVVRYCSGKCQILHWRQGHKEECRPPEEAAKFGLKSAFEEEYGNHGRNSHNEVEKTTKLVESSSDEGTAFKSSRTPGNSIDGAGNSSQGSASSFSGFSSSPAASDSSDTSMPESISSFDSRKSDEQDTAHGISDKISNVDNAFPVEPLSPKFATLVDSADVLKSSGRANPSKIIHEDGQVNCKASSPPISSYSKGRVVSLSEDSTVHDFWDDALDSTEQMDCVESCSTSLMSRGTGTKDAYDSGSTLRFSFNLAGNITPPLCKQSCEKSSGDALQVEKPYGGSTLSEEVRKGCVDATNFPSTKHEKTKCADKDSTSNCADDSTHHVKPQIVRSSSCHSSNVSADASFNISAGGGSLDAKSIGHSPTPTNGTVNNTSDENRDLLRNRMLSSSRAPDKQAVSKSEDRSAWHAKSGKADDFDKHVVTSSQATAHALNLRNGMKSSVWRVIDQLKGSVLQKQGQSGEMRDVDGKCNEKGLFSYEMFIKLYMWKGAELPPSGLVNCGNSCYANAVLQCLAFTPPLTSYFLQGLHRKACRKKDWCFTCEFESLILKFKEGKSPVSPIGIVSHLKSIGRQLGQGREEDAHEFLRYAIDKMQSVCLMESGKKTFSSTDEETTLIGLTFGGYFRSKIRCARCHGKSERHERMMDLTVEIEGDIGTLEEALRQFTKTETLDGENKYRCCRCKSYEKAKKKLTVLKAPNVLTIALKRFQSGKFGKLNKLVRFPEHLDLTSFMSGTSDKPEYKLYGVIVHVDIMNAAFSGHYVCYVKDSRNKWFKIDDSSVTPVEIERILSKGAYMLFYARSNPLEPKLVAKSRVIPSVPVNKTTTVKSNGKETTRRPQRSTNFHHTSDQSLYSMSMHRLQRPIMEDSSSDNSSLFSSNSDESSCSTASTRDSSIEDLSDYIFGDSSALSSSPYSRYPPTQIYDPGDGYERGGPGGGGRGRSDPFLHSDVKAKPGRDSSSSFNSKEADLVSASVTNQLFGNVKYNVPFRRPARGRTD